MAKPETDIGPERSRRRVMLFGATFAFAATGAALWLLLAQLLEEQTLSGPGMVAVPASVGGPVSLIGDNGAPLRSEEFLGGLTLVYFGYTHCPDFCPTALQTVAQALDALDPDDGTVRALFISVDPARDRPEVLEPYVAAFHPAMRGATGEKDAVDNAARAFRVYYALRTDIDADNYPVDHSTRLYLMDAEWKLAAVFRHDANAQDIVAAIGLVRGGDG